MKKIILALVIAITTQIVPSEGNNVALPVTFSRALTRLLDHGNQRLQQQTEAAAPVQASEQYNEEAVFLPNRITHETLMNLQGSNPHIGQITVLADGIEQEHYELIREYFPYADVRAAQLTTISLSREQINLPTLIWLTILNRFFNNFIVIHLQTSTLSFREYRLFRTFLPRTPLFLIVNNQRIPVTALDLEAVAAEVGITIEEINTASAA